MSRLELFHAVPLPGEVGPGHQYHQTITENDVFFQQIHTPACELLITLPDGWGGSSGLILDLQRDQNGSKGLNGTWHIQTCRVCTQPRTECNICLPRSVPLSTWVEAERQGDGKRGVKTNELRERGFHWKLWDWLMSIQESKNQWLCHQAVSSCIHMPIWAVFKIPLLFHYTLGFIGLGSIILYSHVATGLLNTAHTLVVTWLFNTTGRQGLLVLPSSRAAISLATQQISAALASA